jgi:hypothetical protein
MFDEDIEVDFRELGRLCGRMQTALALRDERRAYCFCESARCLAGAVLDVECFRRVNKARPFIEAAMQNGLWPLAEKSGRDFTTAIEAGIKLTRTRLKRATGN